MSALQFLLRQHPFVSAVFALSLAAIVVMGGKLVAGFVYWQDPAHQQQPLEPWMTPRYVAMSWQLPPEAVARILEVGPDRPPPGGQRPTIGHIALSLGLTMDELEALVRAAAEDQQE